MKKEILDKLLESVEARLKEAEPYTSWAVEREVLDVVGDYVDPPFLAAFNVAVIEGPGTLYVDLFEGHEKLGSWVLPIQIL